MLAGGKAPRTVRHALAVHRDAAAMRAFVQEVQRRNYAAACSHRQRRLRQLRLFQDTF